MQALKYLSVLLLLLSFQTLSFGQSVMDDLEETTDFNPEVPELVDEKVVKKSLSKKIFLITNENQSFSKGDFVSLILDNNLVCRALVAKDINSISGIKILKIYSLPLYKSLMSGSEVKVLRGDDSYFYKSKKKLDDVTGVAISDEEDLFNDTTLLEGDIDLEENKNRIIKTDNIISLNMGAVDGIDSEGNPVKYSQFHGLWSYQIEDNFWVEAVYGQNNIDNYPTQGLHTQLTNFILRVKYTIKAPLYSYLQPYIGYQVLGAISPNAGEVEPGTTDGPSEAELNKEIDDVNDLQRKGIVFGITVLKRLVPGWFFRADVGTDIIAAGFGLEF